MTSIINKQRCDLLNIDACLFKTRSGSHITVYVDVPDVSELTHKELIISQVLLQSVKDEFSETYDDLDIEYFSYHNKIVLCVYPTQINETICIDLTEHIINIIASIQTDNQSDDMIQINYTGAVVLTAID